MPALRRVPPQLLRLLAPAPLARADRDREIAWMPGARRSLTLFARAGIAACARADDEGKRRLTPALHRTLPLRLKLLALAALVTRAGADEEGEAA